MRVYLEKLDVDKSIGLDTMYLRVPRELADVTVELWAIIFWKLMVIESGPQQLEMDKYSTHP